MKESLFSFLKDKKVLGALVLAIVGIGIAFYLPNDSTKKVSAAAGELCGFAWASSGATPTDNEDGVGWVSFNSKDCNPDGGTLFDDGVPGCPTSGTVRPYGVTIDSSNHLTGYAWSSNIGWIRFGGLSGFPTAPGNSQTDATLSGTPATGGNLYGWARACSAMSSSDCSGSASGSSGWDGWISLAGSTVPSGGTYRVNFNTIGATSNSYSWGGNVVGWLRWDVGSGVHYCDAPVTPTLSVELTATPPSSDKGQLNNVSLTVDLSGTATGLSDLKFDCTNNGSYELVVNDVSGNTYTTGSLCDYGSVGNHVAAVEVTRGGITATDTVVIPVNDDGVNPGPGGGGFTVECVAPTTALVNRDVIWKAIVTNTNPAPHSYAYQFNFTDGLSPASVTPADTDAEAQVTRRYASPGRKNLAVTVTEGGAPPVDASCSDEVNVIVNPIIIET